jgi:hypothetical protein
MTSEKNGGNGQKARRVLNLWIAYKDSAGNQALDEAICKAAGPGGELVNTSCYLPDMTRGLHFRYPLKAETEARAARDAIAGIKGVTAGDVFVSYDNYELPPEPDVECRGLCNCPRCIERRKQLSDGIRHLWSLTDKVKDVSDRLEWGFYMNDMEDMEDEAMCKNLGVEDEEAEPGAGA